MMLTLYRGSFTEELGNWYSTDIDDAIMYCRNQGIIATITIDLDDADEGEYLLTKTVIRNGHTNSWGKWVRGSKTWYYISPSYLDSHISNVDYTTCDCM